MNSTIWVAPGTGPWIEAAYASLTLCGPGASPTKTTSTDSPGRLRGQGWLRRFNSIPGHRIFQSSSTLFLEFASTPVMASIRAVPKHSSFRIASSNSAKTFSEPHS